MGFNLQVDIRNMTEEERKVWNAPYPKEDEYIISIHLKENISDMLSSKIGTDTPFYRKDATTWEAEYIDKDCGIDVEAIEEIFIDDFLEAFEEDFDGCDYEIAVFRERFEDIYDIYQGEFEENLQKWFEEYSNLREVLTMSRIDAERLCKEIYIKGWRDFKVRDDEDTISLGMAINIYGDELDSYDPFDLVFYDEQGFECGRVPKMYTKDHDKFEKYDNLVNETLDDLDEIIQYVYDYRDSYEFHKIKIGDYYLIISPNYDN